ncbi:MAG: hypothetical protein JNJ70_11420 [Verrucomicrobiales bacterium]|nr:hypothetical protein [Verrucomicrobiales bacterium]
MNLRTLCLFLALAVTSSFFASCESMSTDPAPGGITGYSTGMNPQAIREWQDRSIRQLAY